jgi:P4 family phage/plasmid primase-like protien
VKVLTGGDTISARQLYGQPFTFRPSHTVLLVTNHRPRVGDEGEAVWGRLALVPWTETIPERERVKGLAGQLVRDEGGAILAWAIAGAVEYLRAGLGTPDTVVEATRDYRDREDHFGTWLADCVDEHEAATARAGELMASYRDWVLLNGAPPLTDAALRERLERRGFTRDVRRGGRVSWLGLRLGGDR